VLAQRLALLIDNARLFQEREDSISRLETERDLRLKFVSILAHDLRGPLSAAKMAAQGIAHRPRAFEQQRELAIKVDRSVDRADRMIRDLLDVSRIHAGERLALRLEECDLGAVAHDVVTELESIHGQRFMLDADAIRGVWSCEELRRAIWNLSTNAVKYGAADRPVQITVKRVVDHACVSVHNEGRPLSWDEKENLFVPFSRTRSAEAGGPRGWGLGLTLVRGCVEAHGGSVDVESAPGEGTTFVLRFPLDARPYQPSDAAPSPSPPAPV
jgi:signal transduction histidine kinase